MKVLITGAGGFVGPFLRAEIDAAGYTAVTTDVRGQVDVPLDLLDAEAVTAHFAAHRYDAVVHLAGISSVSLSWKMPKRTLSLNVFPALHIAQAVAETAPATRLLAVGSADQYGVTVGEDVLLDEDDPCRPRSPYAVSKYAQEGMLLALCASLGLDVIATRSFNHIGPGQEKGFVISDFASALADIMRGAPPAIKVGNLDASRDFTDVRDVARAYRLLLEGGRRGEVYNVGSGIAYRIGDILQAMIQLSGRVVEIQQDPERLRPVELLRLRCDNTKLQTDTGWSPTIPLEESLRNVLDWWLCQAENPAF